MKTKAGETLHSNGRRQEEWVDTSTMTISYMYKMHFDQLTRYGLKFADIDRVQDCIQELFLDFIRKPLKTDQPQSIQAYLKGCLKYKLMKKPKHEQQEISESQLNQQMLGRIAAIQDETTIPDRLIETPESNLSIAFRRLSFRSRKALLLHYVKGLSHRQLAETFDLNTEEAARSVVHRAKEQLRKMIKEMG